MLQRILHDAVSLSLGVKDDMGDTISRGERCLSDMYQPLDIADVVRGLTTVEEKAREYRYQASLVHVCIFILERVLNTYLEQQVA